ncbi:MAG TPA: Bax inhibitor-1 family protein [Solirubrobacteraceae bacterium]|nr:Bax inhibitor-1 family protein [Solirubrobacteraceae bacterium]
MPTYEQLGFGQGAALTGDRARSVFGHVMGLVACTLGFAAAGAYLARDMKTGGFVFFLLEIACIFGLQAAAARGRENLATTLLFGLGLFAGMFVSPLVVYYAHSNPGVVYQAAGSTALFTGAVGAYGYTTRRDLSGAARMAFFGLLGVLLFGLVAVFVAIPHANIIYSVIVLAVFTVFTAFDFQRLKANPSYQVAPLIAASIFLDIFNVFIVMLSLFGGGNRR